MERRSISEDVGLRMHVGSRTDISYKKFLRTRTWHIMYGPNKNKARFLSKLNQPTQSTSVHRISVTKSAHKSSFIGLAVVIFGQWMLSYSGRRLMASEYWDSLGSQMLCK
jgi:hypothetical protein